VTIAGQQDVREAFRRLSQGSEAEQYELGNAIRFDEDWGVHIPLSPGHEAVGAITVHYEALRRTLHAAGQHDTGLRADAAGLDAFLVTLHIVATLREGAVDHLIGRTAADLALASLPAKRRADYIGMHKVSNWIVTLPSVVDDLADTSRRPGALAAIGARFPLRRGRRADPRLAQVADQALRDERVFRGLLDVASNVGTTLAGLWKNEEWVRENEVGKRVAALPTVKDRTPPIDACFPSTSASVLAPDLPLTLALHLAEREHKYPRTKLSAAVRRARKK